MPLPDISKLTAAELVELHGKVLEARSRRQGAASTRLASATASLNALIGPDAPTAPGMTSLTEVQKYTNDQIDANNALAHRLGFQATEQLARILRDIVTVVEG